MRDDDTTSICQKRMITFCYIYVSHSAPTFWESWLEYKWQNKKKPRCLTVTLVCEHVRLCRCQAGAGRRQSYPRAGWPSEWS